MPPPPQPRLDAVRRSKAGGLMNRAIARALRAARASKSRDRWQRRPRFGHARSTSPPSSEAAERKAAGCRFANHDGPPPDAIAVSVVRIRAGEEIGRWIASMRPSPVMAGASAAKDGWPGRAVRRRDFRSKTADGGALPARRRPARRSWFRNEGTDGLRRLARHRAVLQLPAIDRIAAAIRLDQTQHERWPDCALARAWPRPSR